MVRLGEPGAGVMGPSRGRPDLVMLPPSWGFRVDEHGHSRPVMFMAGSAQYVTEGLAAGLLLTASGLGFLVVLRVRGCV